MIEKSWITSSFDNSSFGSKIVVDEEKDSSGVIGGKENSLKTRRRARRSKYSPFYYLATKAAAGMLK